MIQSPFTLLPNMHRLLGFTTRTHRDPLHRNVCDGLRFEGRESLVWRLLPALLISLTTALSAYLYSNQDHVYSGRIVPYTQNNRISVQVIVQICVYILALTQIYVLQRVFNFATRLRVAVRGLNLEQITLLHAISSGVTQWTLPLGLLLITFILARFLIAPSILWTGSLTPVLYLELEVQGNVAIPAFTSKSKDLWDFEFPAAGGETLDLVSNCQHIRAQNPFITNCPVPTLQGQLLLAGSGATPSDGKPRTHAKHASPMWTYEGRSFGVGTSVGLADPVFPDSFTNPPAVYSYNETGYKVQVDCAKNPLSKISIILQNRTLPVSTYFLEGLLPNDHAKAYEAYPILSFNSDYSNLCAWAAHSNSLGNYISIATGQGNYSYLNTLQCKVDFIPTLFTVNVNTTSQSISIQPQPNTTTLTPFDLTSRLISNTLSSLHLLSLVSPTLYTSSLGTSIQSNIMSTASLLNAPTITESIISLSVSTYFEAILDDILLAYSTSQLILANDTLPPHQPVTGLTSGVKIGSWIYHLLSLILNCLLVIILLAECIRTHIWSRLPVFNPFDDIRHAIIGASAGGAELATAVAAAKDSKGVMVGVKESNFVDGMVALGVPSVDDVGLEDIAGTVSVDRAAGRGGGAGDDDGAVLVVRQRNGGGVDGQAKRGSRFSGGWVGVGGRAGAGGSAGSGIGTAR